MGAILSLFSPSGALLFQQCSPQFLSKYATATLPPAQEQPTADQQRGGGVVMP
jgi:hypothetical protein